MPHRIKPTRSIAYGSYVRTKKAIQNVFGHERPKAVKDIENTLGKLELEVRNKYNELNFIITNLNEVGEQLYIARYKFHEIHATTLRIRKNILKRRAQNIYADLKDLEGEILDYEHYLHNFGLASHESAPVIMQKQEIPKKEHKINRFTNMKIKSKILAKKTINKINELKIKQLKFKGTTKQIDLLKKFINLRSVIAALVALPLLVPMPEKTSFNWERLSPIARHSVLSTMISKFHTQNIAEEEKQVEDLTQMTIFPELSTEVIIGLRENKNHNYLEYQPFVKKISERFSFSSFYRDGRTLRALAR